MRQSVLVLIIAGLCLGCDTPSHPPFEVSEVAVYAPLPGSGMSAAYLVLQNNTDQPIVANRFSSPQFSSVELHETQISDGVSRMRALEELVIPAGSSVALSEGGKHLMLIGADDSVELNATVSIRIGYDDDGTIIISAPLRARFELDAPK